MRPGVGVRSRKTCIKTLMGEVEYRRRVYQDEAKAESGQKKSVYLLDEGLKINKIGNVSEGVCSIKNAKV